MATLIDNGRQEAKGDNAEEKRLEDLVTPEAEEAPETTTEPAAAELPDKYKGKSVADIVEMHQQAEKLLGRQSSEVGELRKVVDEFVMSQSAREEQAQSEPVDFFDDPEKAIHNAINTHPAVKEAKEASENMKRTSAQAALQRKHPDMADILGDTAFIAWVKESSFRTRLLQEADRNFDFEAADEIFGLWKDRRSLVNQTAAVEKQARTSTAKAASTGGASGSGERSRKVFRRADIIKLMRDDPNRYNALSDEIMQAYAEGRVK